MLPQNSQQSTSRRFRDGAIGLWPLFFFFVVILYVVTLIFMPIVYDTLHLPDTLFILNSGWRVSLGLKPGIDYNTFYSGLTSRYLALTYWIFGPDARALDLAVLLQFVTLLPMVFLAVVGRVGWLSLSIIVAVLATTILTRAPMEEFVTVNQILSAHSFSYNRLGLALCLIPFLTVLLPIGTRRSEALAGVAAGIAMAMALMTKWSFVIVLPPTILALLLQRRWPMLLTFLAGFISAAILLDPTGQKFLGTFSYVMAAAGAEEGMGGISGILFKTQRVLLSHIFVVISVVAGLAWTLHALPSHRWGWCLSALIMLAGIGITCLSMGPFGLVGHQILPAAVIVLVVFTEHIKRYDPSSDRTSCALAVIVALGLVLPHVGNAILVTAAAFGNRHEGLIAQGSMVGYIQRYSDAAPGQTIDEINADIAARISREGTIARDLEYPVFADGLAALQLLSPQGKHGIIADGNFNFEFAASAPPVTDFPLWQRPTSPEFLGYTQIPQEADIVMLLRHGGTSVGAMLQGWMGEDFKFCLQTPIWEVHTRIGSEVSGCFNE